MFDMNLWDKAANIPSMTLGRLTSFYFYEGFNKEIDKLVSIRISNLSGDLYCADEYAQYVPDRVELSRVLYKYNICMVDSRFRMLIAGHEETVNKLWYAVSMSASYMEVDFDLLYSVPLTSQKDFKSYMAVTGLDMAVLVLARAAQSNPDLKELTVNNPHLGVRQTVQVDEIMDTNRLAALYSAYTRLMNKVRANGCSDGVLYLLDLASDSEYAPAWRYVTELYSNGAVPYEVKHLTEDEWISGRPINDFWAYLHDYAGKVSDFMLGTDNSIGFEEDLYLIEKAIAAREQNQQFVVQPIIINHVTGSTKMFSIPVEDILNENRLYKLKDYIMRGQAAYNHMSSSGDSVRDGIIMRRLKEYGYGDDRTQISHLLNYFTTGRMIGRKISDLLKSAEK